MPFYLNSPSLSAMLSLPSATIEKLGHRTLPIIVKLILA
jgi:hypothetical protein